MKKVNFLFSILCLFAFAGKAQTPYNLNLTGNVSSGTYINTSNNDNAFYINSNQQVGGNSNITYLANKEIIMTDGFVANASQEFYARIDNSGLVVADMTKGNNPWNPIKYERFEIGIDLPDNIQNQIDAFLSTGTPGANKINPYDPQQIKIKAEFAHANINFVRYGFYYKEYKQRQDYFDWDFKPSDYTFRVRVAPPYTGAWTFTIHLIVNNTDISQFKGSFTVQSGTDNDGFLTLDPTLKRFKFQESSNMFFGIGQNVACAGPHMQRGCYDGCPAAPVDYNTQRSYIKDIADNDGNFVRIRLDPWSNAVESRDLHQFLLSDNPILTLSLSQCVNNYDHNQRHMGEFDSTLALCENRGLYIMLNLLPDYYFGYNNSVAGAGWRYNPYNGLLNNDSNSSNDTLGLRSFFTDIVAINYYKKLLFYMQARWGYSPHIALWEYVNEATGLGTYTDGVPSLYKTSASFRTIVDNWICGMKDYFEHGDDNNQAFYPYHLQTNGHARIDNSLNGPQCMDVYSENNYSDAQHMNVDGRNGRAETYWYNNKAFLFGEVGADERCDYMDKAADVEFHNAVWAGTFSGALTTPLYWIDWEQKYNINHRENFAAVKAFTDLIDFSQQWFPQHSPVSSPWQAPVFDFQLRNSINNPSLIYGFAQNSYHYWRTTSSIIDTINTVYYQALSYYPQTPPRTPCYSNALSLEPCYGFPYLVFYNLQNGYYKIEYYNTYTGALKGIDFGTASSNQLFLNYNFDCGANADVAYILTKLSARNASSDTSSIADTLVAIKADTAKFVPVRVTSNPPPQKNNAVNVVMVKNKIKVYPNPAQDFVRIVNEGGIPINTLKLFNLVGEEMPIEFKENQINISHLAAGAYLLHINCNNYESVFKIIKVY